VLVAHVCNPSYLEAEIGRTEVQDQPGQIVQGGPISKITRAKMGLQTQSPDLKPQSHPPKKFQQLFEVFRI
jgi:hypothetical protein